MVILDVKGASIRTLSADVIMYMKKANETNNQHYPLGMKRVFVVNSPFWLAGVWSKMKELVPSSVQVDFLAADMSALKEYIDQDQIPSEYGGESQYCLFEHPYEVGLNELVANLENKENALPRYRNEVDDVELALPTVSPSIPVRRRIHSIDSMPVRRRIHSVDRKTRLGQHSRGRDLYNANKTMGDQGDVFTIVSIIHCVWSAVQGAIESSIPLWILSPTTVGGLGYSPSRSGVTMFCACLVLLWVLRKEPSRLVSRIPSKGPLRALRIGAGSESVLLGLLVYVSRSTL
jgi:hypothetical protein